MAEEPDHDRLDRLDAKIAKAKAARAPETGGGKDFRQADMAWRMVIELVSGIGIGFAIGYGLDVLLGTMPFLMVTFVLLGFVAGVRVMLRTAAEMQTKRAAQEAADDEGK